MTLSSLLDRRPGLVLLLGLIILLTLDQLSTDLNVFKAVSDNLSKYIADHGTDTTFLFKTLVGLAKFLKKVIDALEGQERLMTIAVGATIPYYSSSSPLSFTVGLIYLFLAYFSSLTPVSLLIVTLALLLLYALEGYSGKFIIIGFLVFYYVISVEDFIKIVDKYNS
uniref:Uncharacterized protein n=1 Tax=Riboviria sp. TaxID=2585031 RepID=A0A8B0RK32_9VIRU|nr:hypothetical protein [Riboviria sp.]